MIKQLYHHPFIERLLHTQVYCLKEALKDCETVLDLGCGPDSPLQHCKNINHSVGVEPFAPYLERSKDNHIHTEYLDKKIQDLEFPENSFDTVIMIEVLEHLTTEDGFKVLRNAERWARKKVVLTTPNGFVNQNEVDANPLQKHLSGWDYKEMTNLGYRCQGLAGLKFLRQEKDEATMDDDLTVSIRFKPKFFWFIIATLSQLITYYLPQQAFELFCVKEKSW